jgi:hypothetical protein
MPIKTKFVIREDAARDDGTAKGGEEHDES